MKGKNKVGARERIVETACRLFYTQGYNATGINQVIAEAEVAKASLYQHFPSKEDLLEEYLRLTAQSTNETLRSLVNTYSTVKEKVLGLFDFLIAFAKQTSYHGCHFLNVASEIPKENEKVKGMIKLQKNQIRLLFADILTPDGKENLADEMYVLFDAALIASKVYGEDWPVETARNIAAKLV